MQSNLAVFWSALAMAGGLIDAAPAHAASMPVPVFRKYCFECHDSSKGKPKGGISLDRLVAESSVGAHAEQWDKIAEMLETAEMPPSDATEFPTASERQAAATWARTALQAFERAHAGEPGR